LATEPIIRKTVLRFRSDQGAEVEAALISEVPLTIFLDDREVVTLLCTGHHLEDLVLGFLKSEGLLDTIAEVEGLEVDENVDTAYVTLRESSRWRAAAYHKRAIGSGCGRVGVYYRPLEALQIQRLEDRIRVPVHKIRDRMRDLNRTSVLYRKTRCTHHAALAGMNRILVSREDIGRHNAADMIVGYALRHGLDLRDKILLTTGRASSEIVLKAARVGLPILVSRSAPTHLGVEIAERVGLTLIGYVRGSRMTAYTHFQRLSSAQGQE
jgi:FdhD protein